MRRTLAITLASVALVGLSAAPAWAADCEGPVNICPTLGLVGPIGPIPIGPFGPFQIGPINFWFPPCPK